MFRFLTILIFTVSGLVSAQDESPPPLNPYDSPWGEPASQPINSKKKSDTKTSSPDEEDAGFVPPSFGGFSSGSSKSQKAEGKSSFMLIEPSSVETCQSWSNQMLSNKSFPDFNDCQFNLERKLEDTRSAVEQSIDKVERFKLKKMLRGQMANEDRKKNQMDYTKLLARLKTEAKKGCVCIQK